LTTCCSTSYDCKDRNIVFITNEVTTEIYTLSLHDALPIFDGAVADEVEQSGHRLALVDGVEDDALELCGGADGLDRRLVGDSVGRACPAGADVDLGVGDLAAEPDVLCGGVRDPLDLGVRLLRRC